MLRLIAVYAASGLAGLWLAHRFLLPLGRRAGAALLLLPLILTGRAVVSGGFYGPLNIAYASAPLAARAGELPERRYENGGLSDVAIQMVPWRKATREALLAGRVPLLNRFSLSGDILLGGYQPGVFHPSTWLGLLLPLATAWTFAMVFTQFTAGLFAFLFLRELRAEEPAAFFGAAAWTLSSLVTTAQGWTLAGVFTAFPLLLLGLSRLARGAPGGMGAMLVASILMWVAGHAETVLYTNSAAGVFFLFELARSRAPLRAAGRAVGAGVLAFAISAAAVLPFLEALPQTIEWDFRKALFAHAKKSVSLPESLRAAMGMVFQNAYAGVSIEGAPKMPPGFLLASRGYAGGLALALAAFGLASRHRAKWGLLAAGLSSLLMSIGFPGITDAITLLPLFDIGINGYFAGVALFCLASRRGMLRARADWRGSPRRPTPTTTPPRASMASHWPFRARQGRARSG